MANNNAINADHGIQYAEVINGVGSMQGTIGYVDPGSADQATNTAIAININGNAPTLALVENNKYPFWAKVFSSNS